MFLKSDHNHLNDSVLSFMISENVRGRFARIDESLCKILSQHDYPVKVSGLIAEAILLAVMIGQAIKLKWKLSLQIRGSGPLKLIAVDYFSPMEKSTSAKVRAYAKFDPKALESISKPDLHLLGKGFFAVLVDQGAGSEPYQGITPLMGNSLAHCAEMYFAQSEQLPTAFKITVGQSNSLSENASWVGGGIMLQQLPNSDYIESSDNKNSKDSNLIKKKPSQKTIDIDNENWSRSCALMHTIEEFELVGPHLTPKEVLHRLFHEESLRMFCHQSIEFGCSCSVEKVSRALSIYSAKDIQSMTTINGDVTADCQFCGAHFILNPNQLGFEVEG